MQFYLVAGLVRDLMVFHPLPHAHDALPKAGIYAIRRLGDRGGAHDTVEQEQTSSSFRMDTTHFTRKEVELADRCLGRSSTIQTDRISPPHLPAIAALYLTLILRVSITRQDVDGDPVAG